MTDTAVAMPQPAYTLTGKRVWIAGHRGMVGSALARRLASIDCEVLTVDREALDLRNQAGVSAWLAARQPHAIFLAAAKVGGILANDTYPGQFLYDNLAIQGNVIEGARRYGVEKLLFLGSSCIYPKLSPQPIPESALLTGPLEPTNEWYAIAKIAGLKLAEAFRREYGCDFISAMPTNLYGQNDNFDLKTSHVLPALLRKVHEAKENDHREVIVWGSGKPLREFMYVDDCADALVHVMQHYSEPGHINIGTGIEVTVLQLANTISDVVSFEGTIAFDKTKPDGTPRKLLDCSLIRSLGWVPKTGLREGIEKTYQWYIAHL